MKIRDSHLQIAVCATALILVCASAPTAYIAYLVIAGYALTGKAQLIQALFMSWLFNMINPGIAPDASAISMGRYLILLAAACSAFVRSGEMRGRSRISSPVLDTLLIGVFLIVHSLLFSPLIEVSLLKALSWTVAASTVFSAWGALSSDQRALLSRQIFCGLIAVMFLSLPLLPFSVGYLRNGSGFQGILNHPQAFGPTMGILGAWAWGLMMAKSRPAWGVIALFGICILLVVLSEARTAGVALALGIALATAGGLLARGPARGFLPGLRSKRVYVAFALAVAAAALAGPSLSDRLEKFISKGTNSTNLTEAYEASRGFLIARMWANIKSHPLRGIGFGIASDPGSMIVEHDPIFGLPTGAAVEKGVLPLAVLEEIGAFGFIAVGLWLWTLMFRTVRGGHIAALTVLFVVLLMNMGESVLFSPGGLGLLSLILMGWAASERGRQIEVLASNA